MARSDWLNQALSDKSASNLLRAAMVRQG